MTSSRGFSVLCVFCHKGTCACTMQFHRISKGQFTGVVIGRHFIGVVVGKTHLNLHEVVDMAERLLRDLLAV